MGGRICFRIQSVALWDTVSWYNGYQSTSVTDVKSNCNLLINGKNMLGKYWCKRWLVSILKPEAGLLVDNCPWWQWTFSLFPSPISFLVWKPNFPWRHSCGICHLNHPGHRCWWTTYWEFQNPVSNHTGRQWGMFGDWNRSPNQYWIRQA